MPDEQNVTDAVPEGTPSPEGIPPEGTPEPQPLPPEVQEAIRIATEKAAKDATEAAKREIQSAKDKARREVEQARSKATYAETYAQNYQKEFGSDDPDRAEIARLKAEKAARDRAEGEAQTARAREKFDSDFKSNLSQIISAMGIDPNSEKIDWAEDVTGDYLAKQRRVLESATKLSQEVAKSEREKLEQRLKDIESKVNQEANSVDTGASGGAAGSDAEFKKKWASGEIPATKANLERAQKLMK